MTARRGLYRAASVLGDVEAARKGKLPQRMVRKAVYRRQGRLLRRAFRAVGL